MTHSVTYAFLMWEAVYPGDNVLYQQ